LGIWVLGTWLFTPALAAAIIQAMSSTEEIVRQLGKLAKLALTPEEIERFSSQTDRIIAYFQSLRGLDLTRVEPTSHVVDIECYRRPDEAGATLKCLPETFPYLKHNYVKVPKVIQRDRDSGPEDTDV
jgi:aspartyl-tRNA(Asn)/glutamyl-tRNA(Gln) amidotransferase subunit C